MCEINNKMKNSHSSYYLFKCEVGSLDVNCYFIADASSRKAAIIDPGASPENIEAIIEREKLIPVAIINTHGHYDHIGADAALKKKFGIPLLIHRADAPFLTDSSLNGSCYMGVDITGVSADRLLDNGDTINVGALEFTVIHTPGHTPGGICLWTEDLLFTGDTLFCGSVGRCDLAGGDEDILNASLKILKTLPETLRILPGHGPECTLSKELRHNPYL